jgi:anthranilate synthase component 2
VKVLVIDNYDSFVYNLVQYIGELGAETIVYRNDQLTLEQVKELKPDRIVISPGPGTPEDTRYFGICTEILQHGKTSKIKHDGKGVFKGVHNPFTATRYHSLAGEKPSIPSCLEVTAESTDDGEVMGVRHVKYPIEGVQFHPESILCEDGKLIVKNFLEGR